jgi:hypothetical protein
MDDPSLNDYFDKSFLKKYNYHIVNFNFNEFKDHIIQKYGKQYKFTKIDIQFYKVYYLFNTITDYGDGDIIIRGRTDFSQFSIIVVFLIRKYLVNGGKVVEIVI